MVRGAAFIPGMGIAQHPIRPVPGIGCSDLGGIGKIARGTGGYQIMFAFSDKMRSGLPDKGRLGMREMGGILPGHAGEILCQIGNDSLGMHPFKEIIAFSILR